MVEIKPSKQDDATTLFSFEIKSSLTGPIEQMSPLRQSLLFAELASISYFREDDVRTLIAKLGFHDLEFFDKDGSQAYSFHNDTDRVIACRGTEPNEWNDIKADADAVSAVAETVGRVHRGFKQEVDDLWPRLETALTSNDKTLWFAGHSLGGAMATICAGRCLLSHINSNPKGLFTFGSPRVGDKAYINYFYVNHLRWVNNNDIVTRMPPAFMGYRHHGTEKYIDAKGRHRKVRFRFQDRLRGLWAGLKKFQIDYFSDHSVDRYIEHIVTAVEKEEGAGLVAPPSNSTPMDSATDTPAT